MKKLILISFVLAALVVGILFIHKHPSGGTKSITSFTNGGTVLNVGAFTINGTNVPMSNITVKAMQSIPSDTNKTPQ